MKNKFLLLALLPLTLCSCNKQSDNKKLMVDFEDIHEIMSVKVTSKETTISLNENMSYVSSGSKSMKLTMNQKLTEIGYYEDSVVQFIPNQQYFSISDFSDVCGISLDIWNVNSFDIDMCFTVNNKAFVIGYKTLKPGLNNVEFKYDRNQVLAITDKQLLSLDFCFYSGKGNETIYMDNVKLETTTTPYTPYDFNKLYDKNMIFAYDDFIESMCILDLGGYDSVFSKPRATINKDTQYIKEGTGSLKLDFFNSPKTKTVDNTRARTYDKIVPDFNNYKLGDWGIKCDIYNPTNKDLNLEMTIFSNFDDETYSQNYILEANSWSDPKDLIMSITDIREAFTAENLSILTIVFNFKNIEANESVYIDNLRIERRNAN